MEIPVVKCSNIKVFILFSIIPISIIWWGFPLENLETTEIVIYLLFPLGLEYLASFAINFYNIYEEYIEIYYPMRIKKRQYIYYSDIQYVKYYGDLRGGEVIHIYQKCKKKKKNPQWIF